MMTVNQIVSNDKNYRTVDGIKFSILINIAICCGFIFSILRNTDQFIVQVSIVAVFVQSVFLLLNIIDYVIIRIKE